jgi:hypothetical protein
MCESKKDLERVKKDWQANDTLKDKVSAKILYGLDEKKDDPDVVRQVKDIAFREEMMKQPLVHYEQIDKAIKEWK